MNKAAVCSLCLLCITTTAYAGPADYLYTPHIEYGERELDIKYGNASTATGAAVQAASIGLGYGVSEYWFTEGYLKQKRGAAGDSTYVEWENRFLIAPEGVKAVDVGWVTELEMPLTKGQPWEFRMGPLFQKRLGDFRLNGNVIFERAFGAPDEHGTAFATNLGYQWQARYHGKNGIDFGVQGFGEVGAWNRWSTSNQQNHRAGPVMYGKVNLASHVSIKYNAAWLFGLSGGAPDHTFRLQLEHEF
ncbi:MAG: hypothetical protein PHY62_04680 [Gallionella sp.]|nr:hypothetical protein [Gallionella sp.]